MTVLPLYTVKAAAEAGTVKLLAVPEWQAQQAVQLVLHRGKAATPQVTDFPEELDRILTLRLQ